MRLSYFRAVVSAFADRGLCTRPSTRRHGSTNGAIRERQPDRAGWIRTTRDPGRAHPNTTPPKSCGYASFPVARGLVNPWSLAFLPDPSTSLGAGGVTMLVTEKEGRLRIHSQWRSRSEG